MKLRVNEIENIIRRHLPIEEGAHKTVIEAMNYSVNVGGKRLRPMLMQEIYNMYDGNDDAIEYFMVAIEMIHTYSLVHDDLPALDNDEYRRGNKTTHVMYGECMAILAGDALLNYAYELAAQGCRVAKNKNKAIEAMCLLSNFAGIDGMIGGQVVDIESEGEAKEATTLERVLFIHENKTAALIRASLMVGALLANAPEEEMKAIKRIGYCIGVAFQIQDDILDITSTLEELGKPIGSDEKNDKTTYVKLVGLEQSKRDVQKMSDEAINLLESLSGKNDFLIELVRSLIVRRK